MALKGIGSSDWATDGDSAIVAEINITPLTDVFLVLLIIFMVTTSVMSQRGVDVRLPQAGAGSSDVQGQGVIISLLPSGAIRVNDDRFALEDGAAIRKHLQSLFQKSTSRLVILEGDRQALLGSAILVMDIAKQAGAEKFAIATASEGSSSSNAKSSPAKSTQPK